MLPLIVLFAKSFKKFKFYIAMKKQRHAVSRKEKFSPFPNGVFIVPGFHLEFIPLAFWICWGMNERHVFHNAIFKGVIFEVFRICFARFSHFKKRSRILKIEVFFQIAFTHSGQTHSLLPCLVSMPVLSLVHSLPHQTKSSGNQGGLAKLGHHSCR